MAAGFPAGNLHLVDEVGADTRANSVELSRMGQRAPGERIERYDLPGCR